jgi:hypothetical protein
MFELKKKKNSLEPLPVQKTEREVGDILNYKLEHIESIQSFNNNMGELEKM